MARPVWKPFFLSRGAYQWQKSCGGSIHGNGWLCRDSWANLTAEIVPQHIAALCREAVKVPIVAQPCFNGPEPNQVSPSSSSESPWYSSTSSVPISLWLQHLRNSDTWPGTAHCSGLLQQSALQKWTHNNSEKKARKYFKVFHLLHWQRGKPKFDWFDQTKKFKHPRPNFRPKKIAAMQKQLINQKQKNRN